MADGASAPPIEVAIRPEKPFIETRDGRQELNFDLLVRNATEVSYRLVAIRLSAFDRSGKLELVRELNENGHPPAIELVGERILPPNRIIDIYQPFFAFGSDLDLQRMHFELLFMELGHAAPPIALTADRHVGIDAFPRHYWSAAASFAPSHQYSR